MGKGGGGVKKEKVRNNVQRILARFACAERDSAPPLFFFLSVFFSLSGSSLGSGRQRAVLAATSAAAFINLRLG